MNKVVNKMPAATSPKMAHEERKRPWHDVRTSELNDKTKDFLQTLI